MSQTRRNHDTSQKLTCVVPKQNIEILTRALHALAKIGEELFVEPVESGLVFRTVHANFSVYAEALFLENFFTFYKTNRLPEISSSSEDNEEKLNCRITMKSCLIAFRSLSCIKRQVDTCLLTIEPMCLLVKFRCNHGLMRSHRLPVIESESLQASYGEDRAPNVLEVGPKTFASVIKNFQSSERDITLAVDQDKAFLQNFSVQGSDPKAVVRSQLKMEKAEFESYKVDHETSITFSLKAFRAALFFADQAEYPLTIKFSSPGDPVIVINTSPVYELRFVLSSLEPDKCDISQSHSQQMSTPLRCVRPTKQATSSNRRRSNDADRQSDASINYSSDNASLLEPGSSTSRRPISASRPSSQRSGRNEREPSTFQRDTSQRETSQSSIASTTGACVGYVRNSRRPEQPPPSDKPVPSGLRWQIEDNLLVVPESDEEDVDLAEDADKAEEDVLPGTPPPLKKKFRQYFQRCFEPTLNCLELTDSTVLAEDSD